MKKRLCSIALAGGLFGLLLLRSAPAREGAYAGLRLWGELLVPSLLPFFAAAGWLSRLGFTDALGRWLAPALGPWLGLSGSGCGVFLLGLSGGYPLGAVSAAEAADAGRISREEAEHLLRFCDNTGPAFAVGALGAGVFGSTGWGLLLWVIHAFTAVLLGRLFRGKAAELGPAAVPIPLPAPGAALTAAVHAAAEALVSIGGNVVFFSALLAVVSSLGFPDRLLSLTGDGATFFRALFTGAMELSSGMGAMHGMPLSPASLALGSFLLGWGGLCVHLQAGAVAPGLNRRGRLEGKLLHGVLSAVFTYGISQLLL